MKLALLGTGRLGTSIARCLRREGHDVRVWNRTAARVPADLPAAATVEEATEGVDAVITVLATYAVSHEVTRGLSNTTLIELTSGTPAEARSRAEWAKSRAIAYLDGAVMVTPDVIGTPNATVLVAGDGEVFGGHSEALALGGRAIHVGTDHGRAAAFDVALITTMWGSMFGALQAAAVARMEGIAPAELRPLLTALQPITDAAVAGLWRRVEAAHYAADETTRASVAVHRAGVDHLIAACKDRGIDTRLPEAFAGLLREVNDDQEIAAVVNVMTQEA